MPFRRIHNFAPFDSYIYKYGNRADKIVEQARTEYDGLKAIMDRSPHVEYIPGIICVRAGSALYDRAKDKFYRVKDNKYWYERNVLLSEIEKIFPEHNSKETMYYKVYSEDYFNQYPGMAKWAEFAGYISKKLWLP
jgi:hypothetical protein